MTRNRGEVLKRRLDGNTLSVILKTIQWPKINNDILILRLNHSNQKFTRVTVALLRVAYGIHTCNCGGPSFSL